MLQPCWHARDPSGCQDTTTAGVGATASLRCDVLGCWSAVGGPSLWSAECPYCYILVVELRDRHGSIVECEACQVGTTEKWWLWNMYLRAAIRHACSCSVHCAVRMVLRLYTQHKVRNCAVDEDAVCLLWDA